MSPYRSVRRSRSRRSLHPRMPRRDLVFESLEDRRLLASVPVETSLDRTAWQTVDGAGRSGLVHVGVTLAEATNATVEQRFKAYQQQLAAGNSSQVFEIAPLKLRLVNFTSFARSLHVGSFVGQYDNVIVGNWKSETLTGTAARDLIVGGGGNDVLKGLDGDDILIGGSGKDSFQGGNGDDLCLVLGASNGNDRFDGGAGTDRVLAAEPGTVVGVDGYANGVEAFEGPGDTIIRDSYNGRTLDFSATQLSGIAEIDAGAGNDTILASNVSPGVYRGNSGDDILDAGTQATTWLYAGVNDGVDTFRDNGAASVEARATAPGTVIGINGYASGVDAFVGAASGDTVVRDSYNARSLDFSSTRLVNIAEVDGGSGNDTIIASNLTPGRYRGGPGDDTLRAGAQPTTWLYQGQDNGYDRLRDNGSAEVTALAELPGTVIGLYGYANGVDVFQGAADTVLEDIWSTQTLDFSSTQLVNIAEVDASWGNDTIIASNLTPGRYRGGPGDDTLRAGAGATTWLYAGTDNGYDRLRDNGTALVTALAEEAGTVIGLYGYANGVDVFQGAAEGLTILEDIWSDQTLDFSSTQLVNIDEVDGSWGHDTIIASNLSPGRYRGGPGEDTLRAGAGATTWLYTGTDNGYDRLRDNGPATVTALAEAAGTVIGLYGYANGVDVFQGAAEGVTILEDIWSDQILDFSSTQLVSIDEVDGSWGHDTIIASNLSPGSYRGGPGEDTLRAGTQPTTWLYTGTDNGYDRLRDNGPATVTAVAKEAGTVIGLYGYANGVDVFQGAAEGLTILEDIWSDQTLDFSNTQLVSIDEIDGSWGHDTIIASNLSPGRYRGGPGEDTLRAGTQPTTWLYTGDDNGYDRLRDNGSATVTAVADSAGTVIGLYGYENGVDVFQGAADGDTVLEDIWCDQILDFSATQLVNIAEVDGSWGNDTIVASNLSPGAYRGGGGDDLLIAGTQPTTWLYGDGWDGADSFRHNGSTKVRAYGPSLNVLPTSPTHGTTGTGLDRLVDVILTDPGLLENVEPAEIAAAAAAADAMNHLIIAAITETGLANDGSLNTADLYDLSAWIRTQHGAEWVTLHGDDEATAETGFHLVQNDGASTWLFDRQGIDTVADGIYHLGFEIVSGQFLNEDGNRNACVEEVAYWLEALLGADLDAGELGNPDVDPYAVGTTGTGLDRLVQIVMSDPGLNERLPTSEIMAGARAAHAMNQLIVSAIRSTGLANDGTLNAADVRDLSAWLRTNHADAWVTLHGDDEEGEETGFHLVQNDGASTRLFDENAVDTVADGIYHLGFEIQWGQLLNEDGNANACVEIVAAWLTSLLRTDLAGDTLDNPAVQPYAVGTTGTGLDDLVAIVAADPGLNLELPTSEITAGGRAADAMNHLILDAIGATGAANDRRLDSADLLAMNAWLQANHLAAWTSLHGDDESDQETGFHLVQNDGATTRLYSQNAVNTVADGVYHIGFAIQYGYFLNEDGAKNVSVETAAWWLNDLLEDELASGVLATLPLAPVAPAPPTSGTTATGLDTLVDVILADPGLRARVSAAEITAAATAADGMNQILVAAIRATGLANDGTLNSADLRDLNAWIRQHYAADWAVLHGDDETNEETGFHLVQNDGAKTRLFGGYNAVDTVADGLYHLGFALQGDYFLNEDGAKNLYVEKAAWWLGELLEDDLAAGRLSNADVSPYAVGTTDTGLDRLVQIVATDPGLNQRIPTSQITAGAQAADEMNQLLVAAIRATGVANDGEINAADVRELNRWLRANHADTWTALHGDDEGDVESGFHWVQNDGASTRLFDRNAVDTVADGIYHLGFGTYWGQLLNEDGNANACIEEVAWWLDELLADDLAAGTLSNPNVPTAVVGTTGTGLDRLVELVMADPGLNKWIATSDIVAGARAADAMNQLIVEAIRATGAANDGQLDALDIINLNVYLQAHHQAAWMELHGDDEDDAETGFHRVQNDWATTRLFDENAIDTVADGLYHLGFDIQKWELLNEDGNRNLCLDEAASWLNVLLRADLADGSLASPAGTPAVRDALFAEWGQ